jgi:hypothetical protein
MLYVRIMELTRYDRHGSFNMYLDIYVRFIGGMLVKIITVKRRDVVQILTARVRPHVNVLFSMFQDHELSQACCLLPGGIVVGVF